MKKYSFAFIFFLVIFSCKKGEIQITEPRNILNDNAFILDSSAILTTNENSFTLKKNLTIKYPNINEIILAAPSLNCPDGMLRKIIKINTNSNSIEYITEESNLNDAFKELHLNSSFTDTFSNYQTFSTDSGTSLTLKFTNNLSIANGVKMNGEVKFNYPKLTIQYEKDNGSDLPKLILIKAELTSYSQGFEITNQNSSSITIPEKLLCKYDKLPPLTLIIWIAGPLPFPLPIRLRQTIDFVSYPFELSGKFKLQISPNFNAIMGCKFEDGRWQNISTYSLNATSPTKFSFLDYLANNGSITARLTVINPRYTLTPMQVGRLACSLEAPNRLTLEIKNSQPNYSLKYNFEIKGSIKQTFWMGGLGSFSLSGNLIEKTLLEGNWQSPPAISSFSPSSAGSGKVLDIIGNNFIGTNAITLGGTSVSSFTVVSETSLKAEVGSGSTGELKIITPGGLATKPGFTFIPPENKKPQYFVGNWKVTDDGSRTFNYHAIYDAPKRIGGGDYTYIWALDPCITCSIWKLGNWRYENNKLFLWYEWEIVSFDSDNRFKARFKLPDGTIGKTATWEKY
jgi:hypothetical protein